MADSVDESTWIEESRRGEPAAFEKLICRYQHMVHSLTYRMTGSMTEAEDLAQEAFIQAYQQLGSFRGEARFSSWIYRIALNLCLNWQKRNIRRERAYENWAQQQLDPPADNHPLAQHVQEALLKLHPKQRAAVVLTTYEGLNHAEAARALGCSETTVSWRLFSARAKLKRLLNNHRGEL